MPFKSTPSFPTTFSLVILLFSIIPPTSARLLLDPAGPPYPFQHPTQPSMSFIMQDILPTPTTLPSTTSNPIINPTFVPFSKPLSTFPQPYKNIPLIYQTNSNSNFPTSFGIAFPSPSSLQQAKLEFGSITTIEEEILYDQSSSFGTTMAGKARGVYVAMSSSDDGDDNHHMMAMTIIFSVKTEDDDTSDEKEDSLKLFGVHRRDVLECHVSVIGGTGKFKDANGYAAIRVMSRDKESEYHIGDSINNQAKTMLSYNVYLS